MIGHEIYICEKAPFGWYLGSVQRRSPPWKNDGFSRKGIPPECPEKSGQQEFFCLNLWIGSWKKIQVPARFRRVFLLWLCQNQMIPIKLSYKILIAVLFQYILYLYYHTCSTCSRVVTQFYFLLFVTWQEATSPTEKVLVYLLNHGSAEVVKGDKKLLVAECIYRIGWLLTI